MAGRLERTFLMIKPDGLQRGLVGSIIKRLEKKGFKLVAMKVMKPSEQLMRQHYDDLSTRDFFASVVEYMSSGPVVPMVWEGLDVVRICRQMIGDTRPVDSQPGTVRGDLSLDVRRNLLHGSDTVDLAKREIALWFDEKELIDWTLAVESFVYQ